MSTVATNRPALDSAHFPREAWQQVTLEAPAQLALFGAQNRGFLQVTLANHSGQALIPGSDNAIAFSFRLLDQQGETIPLEGIRTPLTRVVEPGTKHTQKVAVIIPANYLKGAAAVRIGLVHEGQYWVESLYPQHPRTVTIAAGGELDSHDARLAAASQLWESGKGNGLRWPYGSMMVSERHKLLYIPVPKCACTWLKSIMVELAGIERPDIARELDVHFVTDRFNTGVQLKDQPIDLARDILASDQYLKFGVIRHPFERLVSAYLEHLVYARADIHKLAHTQQVIRQVQGRGDFDPDTGISFNHFVEYILRQDPYDLDPHWRPQYLYFLGVKHINRIFRLEDIGQLEPYLREKIGVEIPPGQKHASASSMLLADDASDWSARDLEQRGAFHPDSFASSRYAEAIREYYREDFKLYNAAI